MSNQTYGTKFESDLQPTHKVINIKEMKVVLTGTKAECLAFLHGLEYADNSTESV